VTFEKENACCVKKKWFSCINSCEEGSDAVKTTRQNNVMVADGSIGKLKVWHKRYSHLNFNDLYKLKKNNMIIGLDISSKAAM